MEIIAKRRQKDEEIIMHYANTFEGVEISNPLLLLQPYPSLYGNFQHHKKSAAMKKASEDIFEKMTNF